MSDYIFNDEVLMGIHIANEKRIARQDGEHGARVETARNFLAMGLTLEQVSQDTDLPLDEVSKLQAETVVTA